MNLLRNQLIWQASGVVILAIGVISSNAMVASLIPFMVIAALLYLVVRGIWFMAQRRVKQPAVIDRTPAAIPPIDGEVVSPSFATTIDPEDMQKFLNSRVIGQELVTAQLTRGVWRRLAQDRRGKPVFTVLLSGPTGTGKTEMAKAIADYMFGGGANGLFRIDCANVLGEAGLQTLIGSPKGFAGSGSWGSLTAHLQANPRSVVLFDEIEKAVTSPTAPMAKLLLSLLDEGVCTEQSDGTRVSATEAVIVMTSNAAQKRLGEVFEQHRDNPDDLVRVTKDTLQEFFAPEFLARVDLVTTVSPLNDQARAQIIALHAGRIGKSYGVKVTSVDASFVNEALRRWVSFGNYGTREIVRWIESETADALIAAKGTEAEAVSIVWADGKVQVT